MNKIKTKKELKNILLNVRNAHRLIKDYQEMSLNLAYYIKDQYKLSEITGKQRFCDPLQYYRDKKYAPIKLWKDMWSWDFIYTYEFEYYYGEYPNRFTDKTFCFSIIQISDTGCYKANIPHNERNEVNSFKSTNESDSVYIFAFEIKEKNENWVWNDEIKKTKKHLLNNDNSSYNFENRFFAKKYDIFEFLNKESTDEKLFDFNENIEKKFNVSLLKNNIT